MSRPLDEERIASTLSNLSAVCAEQAKISEQLALMLQKYIPALSPEDRGQLLLLSKNLPTLSERLRNDAQSLQTRPR